MEQAKQNFIKMMQSVKVMLVKPIQHKGQEVLGKVLVREAVNWQHWEVLCLLSKFPRLILAIFNACKLVDTPKLID